MNPNPDNSDLVYAIGAVTGGIAHELQNYLDNKHITGVTVLFRAFVAGFSGVMLAHVAQHFWGISDMAMIAGGLGGWMGPGAMQFIQFIFRKYFKYDEE